MINTNQIEQLTKLSRALIQEPIEIEGFDLTCPHARQSAWGEVGAYIITIADVCDILALTPKIRFIVLGYNGYTLLEWWENGGDMQGAGQITEDYDRLLEPIESIHIGSTTVPVLGKINSSTGVITWRTRPEAFMQEEALP